MRDIVKDIMMQYDKAIETVLIEHKFFKSK
jgi:hypothetical protein